MRAAARVVAGPDGRGGTRLTTLAGESPLLLRRTGGAGQLAEVHLVGGAAGPLGGDLLRLRIEVRDGGWLRLRSVAASVALPSRTGGRSHLLVSVAIGTGARLDWLPEPLVAAAGCDHVGRAEVDVADGGHLVWRDEVVCGRHSEQPGDVRSRTTVRYAGRLRYDHEVAVGPGAPGWAGGAVLGGARALGQLLVLDPRAIEPAGPVVLAPTAAVLPLAGGGTVAGVTGRDLREVRTYLDPLVAAATVAAARIGPAAVPARTGAAGTTAAA